MNWMRISIVALMLALLTLGATPALAETSAEGAAGGAALAPAPVQPVLSPDNPYLKEIEATEKAVADALTKLYTIQQQDPFNFDAQMDAYYVYLKAESTLRLLKQKAQEWEIANMPSFSGQVLAFEKDIPIRIMETDADQATPNETAAATGTDEIERLVPPEALSQAKAVVGAVVVLQPMRMAVAQAKVSQRKDDAQALRKNPFRTETGRKGEFHMPGLKAGAYSVTVTKKGYEVWRGRIELPKRGETKRTVYLVKYRMLMGTVKGLKAVFKLPLASKPIRQTVLLADAAVYLKAVPMVHRTTAAAEEPAGPAVVNDNQAGTTDMVALETKTKTNKLGRYQLRGLKIGRYELTIHKDGFQPFKGTLYVTKVVQTQNIVMMPKLPTPPPPAATTGSAQEAPMDTPTGASLDQPFGN